MLATPFLSKRSMAGEVINIQIGSSHPTNNIWVWAMQNGLQPEVDRLLIEAGGNYTINWRENYGGTLYKFKGSCHVNAEPLHDGLAERFKRCRSPTSRHRWLPSGDNVWSALFGGGLGRKSYCGLQSE